MEETPASKTSRLRRTAQIALGCLLAVLLGFSVHWYSTGYKPIGRGPAGPEAPRDAFSAAWIERPVYFVGLGDSITAGFGAGPDHGYFARLAKNPSDEFAELQGICLSTVMPNLTAKNFAISSSTSLQCESHELKRLTTQSPETIGIVVITTGGNDILHDYGRGVPREGAMYGATMAQAAPWIANYQARMNRILNTLDERFPGGCYVFLGNIYDPTDERGDIENAGLGLPPWPDGLKLLEAYNNIIANCAAERDNVFLVDIRQHFLGHGIHCRKFWREHYRAADPNHWYYSNLEDPNTRGYDAIRRLFLLEIIKIKERLSAEPG